MAISEEKLAELIAASVSAGVAQTLATLGLGGPRPSDNELANAPQAWHRRMKQSSYVAPIVLFRDCRSTYTKSDFGVEAQVMIPCDDGCKEQHAHHKVPWLKTRRLPGYTINPERMRQVWEAALSGSEDGASILHTMFPSHYERPYQFVPSGNERIESVRHQVKHRLTGAAMQRVPGSTATTAVPEDFYIADVNRIVGKEWAEARRHLEVVGPEELLDAGTHPHLSWPLDTKKAAQ